MDRKGSSHYRADIGAGALKLPESRIVADLLLQGIDEKSWRHAIENENVLQIRSLGTAKRQASLIRARLSLMQPELWHIVRDGARESATQALLAAAIKHSPLLGDFLDIAVREEYRLLRNHISWQVWRRYLDGCRDREPDTPTWSDTSEERLGAAVFRILTEVGFISDTRTMLLRPVSIVGEVLSYLQKHKEDYVFRCMQVAAR